MQLAEMTWPQVAALTKDCPVVIPVAACEQHGRHLPIFTDSLLLGEVVRRARESLRDRALFAPLLWLGNSDHHLDFAGTLSAGPRTYLDVLRDLVENFLKHGFKRIVFINGHGGNIVPGQQAIFELRQKYRERHDLLLLFATYWQLGAQPKEVHPELVQSCMGHACEWETSMILHLAPHLVGDLHSLEAVDAGGHFASIPRGWTTRDRTVTGHIGDPRQASARKGDVLFDLFAADAVRLVEQVIAWDGASWAEIKEP